MIVYHVTVEFKWYVYIEIFGAVGLNKISIINNAIQSGRKYYIVSKQKPF